MLNPVLCRAPVRRTFLVPLSLTALAARCSEVKVHHWSVGLSGWHCAVICQHVERYLRMTRYECGSMTREIVSFPLRNAAPYPQGSSQPRYCVSCLTVQNL